MSYIEKIGMVSFQIDPEGRLKFLDGQVKDVALTPAHSHSISNMNKNREENSIER